MKRFVLLVAAVSMCCLAASAENSVKAVLEKYSRIENVGLLSIDRKTFNLVKAFIPMDRGRKRLINALNLERMDILDVSGAGETVRGDLVAELEALASAPGYRCFNEDGTSALARFEDGRLRECTICAVDSKTGELTIVRMDCDADGSVIKEMAGE